MPQILTNSIINLESDSSTQKVNVPGRKNSTLGSSSTLKINTYKNDINQENREKLMTYLLIREQPNKQVYTNPVLQNIKTSSFFADSPEASNPKININSTSLVNDFINCIKSRYILINSVDVIQYLSNKKYLIYLLLEAYRQIRKIFNNEKLVLRIVYDPEIIHWKKLIIDIHTDLNADKAFEKLKILDNNWWLLASFDFGNDLDININFDEI